jgi:hypothetical protein
MNGFSMRLVLTTLLLPIFLWAKSPLLAVSELSPRGVSKSDARIIADRLRAEILNTGKVRVLERSEMDKILKEQAFQKSGACDTGECAVEIGRLLSVDRIVVGSLGKLGSLHTITVRLLDVRTGEILFFATEDVEGRLETLLTKSVPALARKLAAGTIEASSVTKSGTGDLQVVLDEDDAVLTLDGTLVKGKSPYFLERLEAGSHVLVARTKDKIGQARIELAPDDLQKLTIPMATGTGSIKIYSEPMGADATLDGTEIGETPLKKLDVLVGSHKLTLRKRGFLDTSFDVSVNMEQTTTSRIKLEPGGVLELVANAPISPKIWKNRDTLYPEFGDPVQLRPGKWHLNPRADRTWVSHDTGFEIRAGETTRMDLELPRYFATVRVRTRSPAKVLIDGGHVGDTPLEYGVLEPGRHTVQVVGKDSSWLRELDAKSGQILSYVFEGADDSSGSLVVNSPHPASVYLDDAYAGRTGAGVFGRMKIWANDSVLPGYHRIRLVSPGVGVWDTVIDLPPSARVVLQAHLVPRTGLAQISKPSIPDSAVSIRPAVNFISGAGALVSLVATSYWSSELDRAQSTGSVARQSKTRTNATMGIVSTLAFSLLYLISFDFSAEAK